MRYVKVLIISLVVVCICLVTGVTGQKNVFKTAIDKDGIEIFSVNQVNHD